MENLPKPFKDIVEEPGKILNSKFSGKLNQTIPVLKKWLQNTQKTYKFYVQTKTQNCNCIQDNN